MFGLGISADTFKPGAGNNAPAYRITVGGTDITPTLNNILISLSLTDTRGGAADQLDLVLSDVDGRVPFPDPGKTLRVWIGWPGALVNKGEFVINETQMSGPPDVITVRARSVDTNQTLPGQHTYSWHKTTLGDIVRRIAKRHGLKPSVAANYDKIRIAHIDQVDESDLNFINRISKRFDAIAAVKAGRLMLIRRGTGVTATGKPLPAILIYRDELDQFSYCATTADSYSGVKARWNVKSHSKLQTVVAGSGDNAKVLKETFTSASEARRAAVSEWQRIQRGRYELDVMLAYGRADLLPESPVHLEGFKRDIDRQLWIATEVRHELSSSGFTTSVRCEVGTGIGDVDVV